MAGEEPDSSHPGPPLNQPMSDCELSQHGDQKVKFVLDDYFKKKLSFQIAAVDKRTSLQARKWKYNNCCFLSIGASCGQKPNQIFESIKRVFNEEELLLIKRIGPLVSSSNWEVQFKTQ